MTRLRRHQHPSLRRCLFLNLCFKLPSRVPLLCTCVLALYKLSLRPTRRHIRQKPQLRRQLKPDLPNQSNHGCMLRARTLLPRCGSFRPEELQCSDARYQTLRFLSVAFAIMMAVIWIYWPDKEATNLPDYYVAIAGVSGLDPAFSLTVRIASRSSRYAACVKAGTATQVSYSYRGTPLAGEPAPGRWRRRMTARAGERGAPCACWLGAVLDSLAEDHARVPVPYGTQREVVSCRDRVGDAAALRVPCDVSLVDAVEPVPQTRSDSGYVPWPSMHTRYVSD